ncbi:HAD-IIA family hydrolase [Maribellus sp. CM-23]|uniref:HAD-IIA family hydrolase n=1 Tax=Maribellus sp. CM-23 TaxID=2781026 RepID=UPI001F1F8B54|nr:HAD-IIA family hydrolase [Maribellus sp. CM-23]MCE4564696.1 HAD-IIA family hydrolase [Maribellus sp. CM-23]
MLDENVFLSSFPDEQALYNHLQKIRHVALDMDGTIYRGNTLFPYTGQFLADLKAMGIGYSFLTNNPSKSNADYLKHLRKMGIVAAKNELYTTAQATIDYLQKNHPGVKRLFILGTASMIHEFELAGFESVPDDPQEEPDAVVVGFDLTLAYDRLSRAAWWVSHKKLYVATNPDYVCPTDEPVVLVDCGSICAAIEKAVGREPDVVLGKPQPEMLNGILEQHNLKSDEVAMVGDRIYTDILMAHRANCLGVLVLSGEATREDAEKAVPKPSLVTPTIETFGKLLKLSWTNH